MTRRPTPQRRQPRTHRLDALCLAVTQVPDRTAEYYALITRVGLSSTQRYLAELEALRQIVSRLESPDEARLRWANDPHSTLSRPLVRRKLRYGLRVAVAA